jgi:hypothetical protein
MKRKNIYVIGGILVVAFGLMFYGSQRSTPVVDAYWPGTNIACLPNGHVNVDVHTHTKLEIFVNGVQETVPANVGISDTCMAEVHTHEEDNELHIELVDDTGRNITLGDFYTVWGQDIQRSGLGLEVYVNDEPVWGPIPDMMVVDRPEDIVLEDGDVIRLEYTRKG